MSFQREEDVEGGRGRYFFRKERRKNKGKKKTGLSVDGIVTMSGNDGLLLGEGGVINPKYRRQPFRLGKGGAAKA